MTNSKKLLSRLSTVALGALLLAIVAIGALFAWPNSYNISNGSMEPIIPVGSKVFVSEQSEYQAGDVITFKAIEVYEGEPIVVTHRLMGFNDDGTLITQGDANKTVDYPAVPVTETDIIGKVTGHIPVVGGVQLLMMSNPLYWLPLVAVLLIFIFWPLLGKGKSAKDASADEQPSEQDEAPAPVSAATSS